MIYSLELRLARLLSKERENLLLLNKVLFSLLDRLLNGPLTVVIFDLSSLNLGNLILTLLRLGIRTKAGLLMVWDLSR